MNVGIGFTVVALLVIGFSYGLVKQIQHTLSIRKANKTANYKRTLFGNYLTCISFAGFLVSYVLNVSAAKSSMITSNGTSASCFIFLMVILIAKFGITPKAPKYTGISN
ncbi:hypothetical protein DVB69_04620 [Sporosarcina sp. BI001-red]|uniref:hypothetical protein n=1 Tax=Sporosarcina sp. BI001-red TaxID=2282866 RepID=UPI000E21EF09|nr:hypothetical protein [Sporosarcina sp. BI001-red]REB10093.1 hypothetical protein DVB69_04620 [Sporosarcina sp. BI001-red]